MRESVVFYKSFYEAIKNIPKENQLDLYNAIFEYCFNGNEVETKGLVKAMFMLIKPNIDNANARYDARVENGKKGGRPKKLKTEIKPNENLTETEIKPKENLNYNYNYNLNYNNNNYNKYDEFVKNNWETLTPFEYETLNNYCNSRGEDIVILAIQEAIKRKNKTLKYVEGILKNWKNRDLNTYEDVKKSLDEYNENKKETTEDLIKRYRKELKDERRTN